jgi:hypothetical protein
VPGQAEGDLDHLADRAVVLDHQDPIGLAHALLRVGPSP